MKKILLIAMTVVMIFAFTACGSAEGADKIAGTWKNTDILMGGESYFDMMGGTSQMEFTFEADGTGTYGSPTTGEGPLKWELKKDVLHIDDNIQPGELKVDGDKLVLKEEATGVDLIFEKQ